MMKATLRRKMAMWSLLLIPLLLIICGVLYRHVRIIMADAAREHLFSSQDIADIPEKTVAVVLGARVYPDGRVSAVLRDRLDTAIALYKAGKVKKLLMSGDNRHLKYNEVTAMRNYAIRGGVPSDDVVRDFAGFRTFDSMYRAKEIWGLDTFYVVSQSFHLPRALYIAQKLGVNAYGVATAEKHYRVIPRLIIREQFAQVLAWVDILVGRDPYFLGAPEGLSGDAQVTRTGEP